LIDSTYADRRELVRYIKRFGPNGISVRVLEKYYPARSLKQRLQALSQSPAVEVDGGQPALRVVLDPPDGGCRQRVRVELVVDKPPRLEGGRAEVMA